MNLFAAEPPGASGARVFHLPPGVDFAAGFAAGLVRRMAASPPEAMARVRLYTNTRRSARALVAAFEAQAFASGAGAAFLPRISLLGELGEEAAALGAPPAVEPLRRRFALMRLVEGFLAAEPAFGAPVAAPALAEALAALLDEMHGVGADPAALEALDVGEHAAHWERTRRFLAIVTEAWPRHLVEAEGGALDPGARRAATAEALIVAWREAPPRAPVIAVGSTGSTRVTARLLTAIARLPTGAVVLPGVDPATDADIWTAAGPEHPLGAIAALLERMDAAPGELRPWTQAASPAPERLALLTQALRPAPVTDRWRAAAEALAPRMQAAAEGAALIEAENPREEAEAVAVALAGAAAEGRRVALVTPDRNLARRVSAQLRRWGVIPDDSAGRPLALTPPGIFLGLLAGAMAGPLEAPALSALLRHPLCGGVEAARRNHLRRVAELERRILRGGPMRIHWPLLRRAVEATGDEGLARWLAPIEALLAPLHGARGSLQGLAALHRDTAERLAAGEEGEGAGALWLRAAGESAARFFETFVAAAAAHGSGLVDGAAYAAAWSSAVAGATTPADPERVSDHIFIWGALEARMQTADLVVLGGLNEGVWPAAPGQDPWLSRPMRAELGLPSPEMRIGLSAHDFLQAASAGRIVLSRAIRAEGAPTVPSRWLTRLSSLMQGVGPEGEAALAAMRARGAGLAQAARALHDGQRRPPAQRPNPRPPVEARPLALSVTEVETLIRDPYAVYARRVLGLRRRDALGSRGDPRELGMALHDILQEYAERIDEGEPAGAGLLMAIARRRLDASGLAPAPARLMLKRLQRAAEWFVEMDANWRDEALDVATEIAMERPLALDRGAFRLRGRADRIDRRPDGYAIFDYKSGAPPSNKQIKVFSKQLALEAAIMEEEGAEGLPPGPVSLALYVSPNGRDEGGQTRHVDLEGNPPEEVWAGFAQLISAYEKPGQGYMSRQRPAFLKYEGDYDHLARYGEWGDAEDAEGEGG